MSNRMRILCAALFVASVPPLLAASSVQKIKNDKVSVTEDAIAPGQAEALSGSRPSMLVYLSGGAAEVTSKQGKTAKQSVRRGQTVFEHAGTTSLQNAGTSELKLVRVEFLTAGKHETWGRSGLPPNYKVLVENRYARAYDIKIAPHSYEQRHTHKDRVVISLSGATLEHILPNGQKQPSTLKTGEILWRPGATHVGHNMGSTELWVIIVEPK